jgi:hypothetical protein
MIVIVVPPCGPNERHGSVLGLRYDGLESEVRFGIIASRRLATPP